MTDFKYDNYQYLINLHPKHFSIIIIILIAFICIMIYSFTFDTYDTYNSVSYYNCDSNCFVKINVALKDTGLLSKASKIYINKNTKDIIKTNISEIMIDEQNKANYQIITYSIDADETLTNNTFQDVKIYYNKERIFNKIINYFIK